MKLVGAILTYESEDERIKTVKNSATSAVGFLKMAVKDHGVILCGAEWRSVATELARVVANPR